MAEQTTKKVHLKKSLLLILSLSQFIYSGVSQPEEIGQSKVYPVVFPNDMADFPWTHTNDAVKIDKRGGGKKQSSLSLNLLNSVFSVKAAVMSEDPIPILTCTALSHPSGFHKLQITGKLGNIHSPVLAELPKHQPYK